MHLASRLGLIFLLIATALFSPAGAQEGSVWIEVRATSPIFGQADEYLRDAQPGERFPLIQQEGDWALVEVDAGLGWIQLDERAGLVTVEAPPPVLETPAAPAPPAVAAPPTVASSWPAFAVGHAAIWEFFQRHGGTRTLGEPISRLFTLHGLPSQLFQRGLLQVAGDGNVSARPLLDAELAGLPHLGGAPLPPVDPSLVAPRPAPSASPTQLLGYLQAQVPESFEGEAIGFQALYLGSVRVDEAFPGEAADPVRLAVTAVELWGYPTSRPQRDPSNPSVVVQRFERAVFRFERGQEAQALPIGEVLRGVLTGQELAPDLASALGSSPYLRQYDPTAHRGPLRPEALSDSRLDLAFAPGRSGDPRFGVIFAGQAPNRDSAYVAAALEALGSAVWYSYDGSMGVTSEQMGLVRPHSDLASVAEQAALNPGATWKIGNEPNDPGQDNLTPEAYADFLYRATEAIRGADPSAVLVGPNVLNWEATCVVCPGFPRGREWSESFLHSYTSRYGSLPLNVWGMHAYSLNWSQLPLVDAQQDITQLTDARAWLTANGLDLPIWLTEFGVIWGFEGIRWSQRPDGTFVASPEGSFRTDRMLAYLDTMYGWLEANPARVERWFLYATTPAPEPYSNELAGIALLTGNPLVPTTFGERHRAWALR